MSLKPFWAFMILKRESIQSRTKLIIPETALMRNAPNEGVVIEVGPTAEDHIKELKGRRILFKKQAGDWLKYKGEEYFVCHEEDVLALVEE